MRNSERGMGQEKMQMPDAEWQMTDAGWRIAIARLGRMAVQEAKAASQCHRNAGTFPLWRRRRRHRSAERSKSANEAQLESTQSSCSLKVKSSAAEPAGRE